MANGPITLPSMRETHRAAGQKAHDMHVCIHKRKNFDKTTGLHHLQVTHMRRLHRKSSKLGPQRRRERLRGWYSSSVHTLHIRYSSTSLMGICCRSEFYMCSMHGSHVGGIHRCHGHSRPCKDNTGTKGHGATLLSCPFLNIEKKEYASHPCVSVNACSTVRHGLAVCFCTSH